jgi:capsular polysaccharide biosynthesis protein
MVLVGLAIGAAYVIVRPPVLTSSALVVIPQAPASSSTSDSGGSSESGGFINTQVVIATSDAVLSGALPHISPVVSFGTLQADTQAKNVTDNILSITATGKSSADAEAKANAVANSYVAYVNKPSSPGGQIHAQLLESATTTTGLPLSERILIFSLLGGVGGVLVGFFISFIISHNDRRLVGRDAVANSIGVPVLASIPVAHPASTESWVQLIERYEPGVVHAWALKKILQQLGIIELGGRGKAVESSLSVLSFSSDPHALALGPQLAVFAASQGIPTSLVIGAGQDTAVIATLRTACTGPRLGERPIPLRLIVAEDGRLDQRVRGFSVIVTVIDGQEPRMSDVIRADSTVIGVSAGGVTAEHLARAATAAASDGREIFGILVADPDPTDQTTGRIPRLGPPARRPLPARAQDVSKEVSR